VAAAVALWLHHRLAAFDWRLFTRSLVGLDWLWLVAATAAILATYCGRALRWAVLMRPAKPNPRFSNLLSATIIGFTAIVLFGRAGEFVRPYLVSVKEKVPLPTQFAAWLLERTCDLFMTLAVFGCSLVTVHLAGMAVSARLDRAFTWGGCLILLAALVLLVILVLAASFPAAIRERLLAGMGFLPEERRGRAARAIDAFLDGMRASRGRRSLALIGFYSALEWVLVAACYWAIARAYAAFVSLSLWDIIVFMGFSTVGAIVQIPGVGGGIQVTSAFVLRELFGVPIEVAAGMALLIWIINFVVIVPVGVLMMVREGWNWRELRQGGAGVEQ
jgi:uncharacterized protein (TIRG00374 family)